MPMMDAFSWNLILAAAGVAVMHTILGPDHYLPFIMLARAGHWSRAKTILVTSLCGVGHILSSLLLGGIGLLVGAAVRHLEIIEGVRGDWAAWGLVAFGGAYAAWGIRRALRSSRQLDPHAHGEVVHLHSHGGHGHGHAHPHRAEKTFWGLFVIFVLGPCEPLIPLFVLPASRGRWDLAILTGVLFGIVTVVLMVSATLLGLAGLNRLPFGRLERWSHALAGGVIALSGVAVLALGL
jgi:hypothetical protein